MIAGDDRDHDLVTERFQRLQAEDDLVVSEFDAVGVTREPSLRVAPPRVAESPVALECRYVDERSFGSCTVVFGEVVHLAVDEEALEGGRPDVRRLRPVSRLGANEWAAVGEVTDRRRIPFSELSA